MLQLQLSCPASDATSPAEPAGKVRVQLCAEKRLTHSCITRHGWHAVKGNIIIALPHTHAFLHCAGEVGLEVCAGKGTTATEAMQSGMWHPCDPVAGTITMNIGDALQYWSDDRLKSAFHHVRVPRGNAYKVAPHSCFACYAQLVHAQISPSP